MNKCRVLWFVLCRQGWFLTCKSDLRGWMHNLGAYSLLLRPSNASFSLKEKVLFWKFDPLGPRARFCACSLLLGSSDVSFLLKEKVLTRSVDIRGWGHVYVVVLFTQDLWSSFFSFKREDFDLEGLSLRERKLDLRESLGGKALGGRALGGLGRRP